jgi:hypothetical protein
LASEVRGVTGSSTPPGGTYNLRRRRDEHDTTSSPRPVAAHRIPTAPSDDDIQTESFVFAASPKPQNPNPSLPFEAHNVTSRPAGRGYGVERLSAAAFSHEWEGLPVADAHLPAMSVYYAGLVPN